MNWIIQNARGRQLATIEDVPALPNIGTEVAFVCSAPQAQLIGRVTHVLVQMQTVENFETVEGLLRVQLIPLQPTVFVTVDLIRVPKK